MLVAKCAKGLQMHLHFKKIKKQYSKMHSIWNTVVHCGILDIYHTKAVSAQMWKCLHPTLQFKYWLVIFGLHFVFHYSSIDLSICQSFGHILLMQGSSLFARSCRFDKNNATGDGGAIFAEVMKYAVASSAQSCNYSPDQNSWKISKE